MATKLKVNYEFVGDSNTPVTRTDSVKHGSDMLNTVINTAVTALNTKANKDYVDAELAKKQDKTAAASDKQELQTAIGTKAESSTVSALSERVSTNETNIATQTSRIDNIVAIPPGSTEGNTELIDIRTGADGKKYPTAGDAVRGQVTDLKSDLNDILKIVEFTQGYNYNTSRDKVDINNPEAISDWETAVIACEFNDIFVVSGRGGYSPRLWAFIDARGNVISRADADIGEDSKALKAPATSAYLIINRNRSDYDAWLKTQPCYKSKKIGGAYVNVDELDDIALKNTGFAPIEFVDRMYIPILVDVVDTSNPQANGNYQYAVVPCAEGSRFLINGKGGGNPRLWAFIDDHNRKITNAISEETATDLILIAPKYATKLIINRNMWDGPGGTKTVVKCYYANFNDVPLQVFKKEILRDIADESFVSSLNEIKVADYHVENYCDLFKGIDNGDGFLYFTDCHVMHRGGWELRLRQVLNYLEQYAYETPISTVINCGDWLGSYDTQTEALAKLSRISGAMKKKFGDNFVMCLGNHDTNYQGYINSESETEDGILPQGSINNTYFSERRISYFRYKAPTYVIYSFDTGIEATKLTTPYTQKQLKWFAESLKTEDEKHIVLLMHIFLGNPFADEITKCADAYNNRTSYTYDGRTYDYSNANGKVAFVLTGHVHEDRMGVMNGIPWCMTINTSDYGFFTNIPFDLGAIDWDNGKLYMYRVAGLSTGTHRTLNIIT